MAWFVGRSVVVIVMAFILGLVVGWIWWRRRKVNFSESLAVTQVTATHQARADELTKALSNRDDALCAMDAEITQLRAQVQEVAGAAAGVSSGSATWRGASQPRTEAESDDPQQSAAIGEAPAALSELVTVPTEPSPETLAAFAIPVEEIPTAEHEDPGDPDPGRYPGANSRPS